MDESEISLIKEIFQNSIIGRLFIEVLFSFKEIDIKDYEKLVMSISQLYFAAEKIFNYVNYNSSIVEIIGHGLLKWAFKKLLA